MWFNNKRPFQINHIHKSSTSHELAKKKCNAGIVLIYEVTEQSLGFTRIGVYEISSHHRDSRLSIR